MIRKYVYGLPWPTFSCVKEICAETEPIPYFCVHQTEKGLTFTTELEKDEAIYGLGENVRGINKRGFVYRSYAVDDAPETESKSALYASHNFLVIRGSRRCFGVFFDDPSWFEFDLGFTDPETAVMTSRESSLNVYVIENQSVIAVVKEFRQLIGRSYIPPKWAFGYIQSRFGDCSEEEIDRTLEEYKKLELPIDSFCLDIDCLEAYQNFTWNPATFPDPERFVREKQEEGIHLIPIIDAAIRKDDANEDYLSGKEQDVFCKGQNGEEFSAYVWPGLCAFPDYFQEKTRKWLGQRLQRYLRMGISGFWSDMNEPSVFAGEGGFRRVAETAASTNENYSFLGFGKIMGIGQLLYDEAQDGKNFCHRIGDEVVENSRVHNLYGSMMAFGMDEGFRMYNPDERFLLFSRSSCIGSHRVSGVWLGDNHSWWSHLLLNLKMLPSMNMCGYLFTGADIGGFNGDTSDELMLRWLELGIFFPLMRNHSCWGTRKQELYRFRYREKMAKIVQIRYALIPYLYSEFMKAALRDECMYRPLAFDYPDDPRAAEIEDQLLLGQECMIAPVYEQNARGRMVYLPEDMLMIRLSNPNSLEEIRLSRGDHYIALEMEQLAFFIRKNRAIPFAAPADKVQNIRESSIRTIGWLEEEYRYEYYNDDGISKQASLDHRKIISCKP